jgi:hypothetical protein
MAHAIDTTPGRTVVLYCERGAKFIKNAKSDPRYDASPKAIIAAYGGHKFRTTVAFDENGKLGQDADCPVCADPVLNKYPKTIRLSILGQVRGKFAKAKCDSKCLHSEGFECACSCGGANHGALA